MPPGTNISADLTMKGDPGAKLDLVTPASGHKVGLRDHAWAAVSIIPETETHLKCNNMHLL